MVRSHEVTLRPRTLFYYWSDSSLGAKKSDSLLRWG